MTFKRNYLLMYLLLLLSFTTMGQVGTVRDQARTAFLEEPGPTEGRCQRILNTYFASGSNGSFTIEPASGIDGVNALTYNDIDDWPLDHLKYLTDLSMAYANTGFVITGNVPNTTPSVTYESILEQSILNGLAYWYGFSTDTSCDDDPATVDINENNCPCATACPCSGNNWYDNYIEKQIELQRIGILAWEILRTNTTTVNNITLLQHIINDLPTSTRVCDGNGEYAGSNLAHVAGAMIARGTLVDGIEGGGLVTQGKLAMEVAMDFAPYPQREGIQRDYSFHQHSTLLYNGGYGLTFLEVVSLWAKAVKDTGTDFDFDESAIQRIVNFVLQGTRWMTVADNTDYSANGRNIARRYPGDNAAVPLLVMDRVIGMAFQGTDETDLMAMRNSIFNKELQGINGHNYFRKSDYVTHHEANYFSSIKMCSDRTFGTETENGENLRGYWLPYGCTFIYKDGTEYIREIGTSGEYESIFPFWDWSYIPGVTSPVSSSPSDLEPGNNDDSDLEMRNTQYVDFVGNVNNTKFGVTAMDYLKVHPGGTVSANKAWFHFGTEIIALGDDITGANLHTTINQSLYVEPHTPGSSGNTQWVEHDGIAYILPDGQTWEFNPEIITGGWNLIDDGCADDCPATGTVFKGYINHGNGNSNDDSYYYIIAPGQSGSSYAGASNPITVLEPNNSEILAVKKNGTGSNDLAGIVYFPPANGSNNINPPFINVEDQNTSLQLKVNHPCALLYDENNHEVCVSSPDRLQDEILLNVITSNGSTSNITFTLSKGGEAGNSKCIRFSDFEVRQDCSSGPPKLFFNAIFHHSGLTHNWTLKRGGQVIANLTGPNPNYNFTTSFYPNDTYTMTHSMTLNGTTITTTEELSLLEMKPPLTITQTVVINPAYNGGNPVMVIAGDLTIADNAHVTISDDMTIMFCGTDAELIVEKGGYLSLGGTVTDFNGQTWKGIRVMGHSNLSNAWPNILEQGRLSVRPNTVIENAQIAIEVGDGPTTTGGLISCTKTNFVNNKQGIVYNYPYHHRNFGVVTRCDFLVDDAYPHASPFEDFIYLNGIVDFRILGSNFTNNIENPNATEEIQYGVGVRAFKSDFIVRGYPSGGVIPSTFNNLGIGIYAGTQIVTTSQEHYIVRNCEFNYCFIGIRNTNLITSTIRSNRFNMGAVPPNSIEIPDVKDLVQSGIVYEGALEGILCEENEFLGNYSGPNEIITVGIFCDNTMEFNNEIKRNTFERMTVGNLAVRDNGIANIPNMVRGLTYFCNTNRELNKNSFWLNGLQEKARGYDISVPGDDNTQSTIRSIQGIPDPVPADNIPAGNTFSYPASMPASNESGVYNKDTNPSFAYWYDVNIPEEHPDVNDPTDVLLSSLDNETTCGDVIEPPCCDPAPKKLQFFQNQNEYNAIQTNVGTTPTTSQVNALAFHQSEMDRAAAAVVRYAMTDTLNFNIDSLYTWVSHMNSIGAELWLARAYLAKGQGSIALSILDSIPNKHNLSTKQADDIVRYREVADLIKTDMEANLQAFYEVEPVTLDLIKTDMEANPGPVQLDTMTLSENTLNALKAYVDSGGQTEIWVKNILTFYGAYFPPQYLFPVERIEEKSEDTNDQNTQVSPFSNVIISPNPARNFVNFEIKILTAGIVSTLEVIDINGRVLQHYSDIADSQTITWNTKDFASGIYFYRLLSGDGKVESGKIVLSK